MSDFLRIHVNNTTSCSDQIQVLNMNNNLLRNDHPKLFSEL